MTEFVGCTEADPAHIHWQCPDCGRRVVELVAPGGRLVEFGWNSHGAAARRGREREALHLFQRGPCLPDVFGTVDRNVQRTLGGGPDE